jgi:phosphatidylinositol alpha-1,6-mannosyltransferase
MGWLDRTVILTVGRLQKRKGHDLLIRALPALKASVPDVLYAIAGAGEELAALRSLVDDQGLAEDVQFLTDLDDGRLAQSYQQCDLFVLPNRDLDGDIEGFGMVLLEAQACGKPVIAGATGGTAETMVVDETGLLVDVEQPEELVGAMSALLTDPERCRSMGIRARSWIEDRFDWDVLSQRAQRMFDRRLTRSHPAPKSGS